MHILVAQPQLSSLDPFLLVGARPLNPALRSLFRLPTASAAPRLPQHRYRSTRLVALVRFVPIKSLVGAYVGCLGAHQSCSALFAPSCPLPRRRHPSLALVPRSLRHRSMHASAANPTVPITPIFRARNRPSSARLCTYTALSFHLYSHSHPRLHAVSRAPFDAHAAHQHPATGPKPFRARDDCSFDPRTACHTGRSPRCACGTALGTCCLTRIRAPSRSDPSTQSPAPASCGTCAHPHLQSARRVGAASRERAICRRRLLPTGRLELRSRLAATAQACVATRVRCVKQMTVSVSHPCGDSDIAGTDDVHPLGEPTTRAPTSAHGPPKRNAREQAALTVAGKDGHSRSRGCLHVRKVDAIV